jgi:hypothetical protein
MRLAKHLLVVACLLLTVACGPNPVSGITVKDISSTHPAKHAVVKCSLKHLKACTPRQRRDIHRFLVALAFNKWLKAIAIPPPWPCVAEAETGSDWTMHGSTYSTAYGIVNDIVYDYASPAVQRKVFSGTASPWEQTDIVRRFAADHGTGGWGWLTRQKCGI